MPLPTSNGSTVITLAVLMAVAITTSMWAIDVLGRHSTFLPTEGPQPIVRAATMVSILGIGVIIMVCSFGLLYDMWQDSRKNRK